MKGHSCPRVGWVLSVASGRSERRTIPGLVGQARLSPGRTKSSRQTPAVHGCPPSALRVVYFVINLWLIFCWAGSHLHRLPLCVAEFDRDGRCLTRPEMDHAPASGALYPGVPAGCPVIGRGGVFLTACHPCCDTASQHGVFPWCSRPCHFGTPRGSEQGPSGVTVTGPRSSIGILCGGGPALMLPPDLQGPSLPDWNHRHCSAASFSVGSVCSQMPPGTL